MAKKKGKKSATLVDPRVDSWVQECDELLSLPAEITDITPIIPYDMDKINNILKTNLKRYDIRLKPDLSKLTRYSFFDSSKFTDFTIQTAEDDFKVHKRPAANDSQETAKNVIDLSKDDPYTIKAMVRFIYETDYDGSGSNRGRISPMLFNARMYEVAERYSIPHLKERAKGKFTDAVHTYWDMDDFSPAIIEVYTSTPSTNRGLRDIISQTAFQHIGSLLHKDDFQLVLVEHAGFSADIVRLLANKPLANPPKKN
ncbi:BTB/POZ domain-containing protein [Nannizzia gypsea CBS 118893]|uniref:BTB/POZ domain-containing protein n=1 Tax=Arthroderma gypseum (strain ATCC MYA-4604 / CBS 118893) TaxID=535722 RepID=E4UY84_ARTGP|nr:BTB/POZ domain-containing protein [Nannizzia gypsea CBS 118893]EFR02047.1 BTB/POZ domain-containing protein [Nannizzia gypsea CBS 118893]